MKKLQALKSVYSYYFPEIRDLISDLTKNYPHEVFLQSISPGLDDFHFKVIDQYQRFIKPILPKLSDFEYRYFTNGSSEGIFHLLVYLKVNYPNSPIYVFKGEYEGYLQYAIQLGITIKEVDYEIELHKLPLGFWFISNPSARNGNIIPNVKILQICRAGHRIILDGAYVGLTKPYEFEISHPNIFSVVTSLSKPLGLFYYRIGFIFTREEIKTLYPNIWFKNIFSLLIAREIFSRFKCDYFYNKYRPVQLKIIKEIKKDIRIPIKPSDSLLLGYFNRSKVSGLNNRQLVEIEKYRRGDHYRFCLTPYFLEKQKNHKGLYNNCELGNFGI